MSTKKNNNVRYGPQTRTDIIQSEEINSSKNSSLRKNGMLTEEPVKKLPREFFLPSIIVSAVLTGLLLIALIGIVLYIIYN